jgi:hypothetical protein
MSQSNTIQINHNIRDNQQENRSQEEQCYIRRQGQPWTRGRSHHYHALQAYLSHPNANNSPHESTHISIPHQDGGMFVAWFNKLNQTVYQYHDEYNQYVQIMMAVPSYTAYINRIVDY